MNKNIKIMNKNIKILCVIFSLMLFITILFSCQERELEYGGRVGRDTRYVVGNGMVQISHINGKDILQLYHTNTHAYSLLDSVTSYKSNDNDLYVISDEGYGVVDKETYKCKLLIFNPEEYFKVGYERHSNGKTYTLSPDESGKKSADKIAFYGYAKLNNPNIVFLDSFDSFNENEQKMLLKLCETNSFDESLLGKSIEITIEENCVVDAEYLKKVQANEKVDGTSGFELMSFDSLNLLIQYLEANSYIILPDTYVFNENFVFDNGKMVTHSGEFVDVFVFSEINN